MIAEFILSAIMGLIAGAILSWFFFRLRKRKIENTQNIINSLEKQEKEGKVFFVDGKPFNFRDQLAPQKVKTHLEELREEQEREPYKPISNLPPLPPLPPKLPLQLPPKEESKKSSNSLNKMLGKK